VREILVRPAGQFDNIPGALARLREYVEAAPAGELVSAALSKADEMKAEQDARARTLWRSTAERIRELTAVGRMREARALLKSAIRDDDPVLFVEHKLLYGMRELVPTAEELVPIGRARVARPGADLTIAAHGYMVTLALRAAEALAAEQVNAEVLDLRTLRPLDEAAILESVGRTQHLVTVEEGVLAGGIGAEVASLVAEKAVGSLDGPIVRVGAADCPVPASRVLEDAVLPSAAKIVAAAKRALNG
jgi:pyruvate/2-oxoglutarate/acetoin dehydrogenase E1 component